MSVVVKVGGHALDDLGATSTTLSELAEDVSALCASGHRVVLVHGGGPQIGELLERFDMSSHFVDGLRVTDPPTMRVVAMALSDVNARIVAGLNANGAAAVGVSGLDASLLVAKALGEPWGRVAGIPRVRAEVLESLLAARYTPVVSSLAADETGELLNCNADTAAGALAGALNAERLFLLSDVDQLRLDPHDPHSAVARVSASELAELVETGAARDGMRPKAEAALAALGAGASSVFIANGTRPHALAGAYGGTIPTTEVVA